MMILDCIAQVERALQRLEDAATARDLPEAIAAAEHVAWALTQLKNCQDARYCELCGIAGATGDPQLCADCAADVYGTTL